MAGKRPSSLDYEAYVDELAVSTFRRALVARRFDKARGAVGRLVQSAERLWRWVGLQHLAVLELARGAAEASLGALAEAERLYPGVPGLAAPPRDAAVRLLLATGAPEAAAARAETGSFLAGLAHLRLGQLEKTDAIERRLREEAPWQAAYLRWERDAGDSEGLRALVASVPVRERHFELDYRLAVCLESEGRGEEAMERYRAISGSEEALLETPLSFVRSLYRLGVAASSVGRAEEARDAFEAFLAFWAEAEIDRNDVGRAKAWLNG